MRGCYDPTKNDADGFRQLHIYDNNGKEIGLIDEREGLQANSVPCGPDRCGLSSPPPPGYVCERQTAFFNVSVNNRIVCTNPLYTTANKAERKGKICLYDYDERGNLVGTFACDGGAGGAGGQQALRGAQEARDALIKSRRENTGGGGGPRSDDSQANQNSSASQSDDNRSVEDQSGKGEQVSAGGAGEVGSNDPGSTDPGSPVGGLLGGYLPNAEGVLVTTLNDLGARTAVSELLAPITGEVGADAQRAGEISVAATGVLENEVIRNTTTAGASSYGVGQAYSVPATALLQRIGALDDTLAAPGEHALKERAPENGTGSASTAAGGGEGSTGIGDLARSRGTGAPGYYGVEPLALRAARSPTTPEVLGGGLASRAPADGADNSSAADGAGGFGGLGLTLLSLSMAGGLILFLGRRRFRR